MDLELHNKVAVVCASSKGIGRACALALAREGAKLAICARGRATLFETRREIEALGTETYAQTLDVTQPKQMHTFLRTVLRRFKAIHVLVNNAGGPPPGRSLDLPPTAWSDAVEENLLSTVRWSLAVAPKMKAQRWGRIVNITSISVKQPIDNLVLSNTARAGVVGFARTLARELAGDNITVNTVCPGIILTDRIHDLAKAQGKKIEDYARETPAGRLGTPEDVGNLVAFLASQRAAYLTGTVIQVDGGLYKGLL
jgi:3-oxoacyl-[acyl-carrier protein] reductase